MVVCHMTSAHSPLDDRIFYKECVSLSNAGYTTYLVASGYTQDKSGVHIIGVGDVPASRFRRMVVWAYQIYLAAFKLDADVYHIHDPELLPYALLLRKKGKKVIFDSHEFYPLQIKVKQWIPRSIRNLVSTLYLKYESFVFRRIDAVIYVAEPLPEFDFQSRTQRCELIGNYPILNEFQMNVSPKYNGRAICYVGGLSYNRGLKYLVQAAHAAKVILYLAGSFESEEFRLELETLPEYSCVRFFGFLDRAGISDLLSKSSVGCVTLLKVGQYESMHNFGVKTLEYMAAALPIIATNVPFHVDMLEKKLKCGVCVEPDDVAALTATILAIVNDPIMAKRMGENGRRAILERYNWGNEEKKLLALYESLLGIHQQETR